MCSMLLCCNVSFSQTNKNFKTGVKTLSGAVITMGLGLVTYDLWERTATKNHTDELDDALRIYTKNATLPGSSTTYQSSVKKANDKYESSINAAVYTRLTISAISVLVAIIGVQYINGDDGSVTVASSADGSKKLGLISTGSQVGLSFKF